MTSIETAKHLIKTKGACNGVSCYNDNCPCSGECPKTMEDAKYANDWVVSTCKTFLQEQLRDTTELVVSPDVAEAIRKGDVSFTKATVLSCVPANDVQGKIIEVLDGIKSVVLYKNVKYGNSALEPIGIFAKGSATNSIKIRLDDKLQRIKNGDELRKNDVADMLGYLTLLCVDQGWTSFEEFKD